MITYYYCVPAKEFEQLTSFGGSPVEFAVKAAEKFARVTGKDYLVVEVLETIEAGVQRDAAEQRNAPVTGRAPLPDIHTSKEGRAVRCPSCGELLIEQTVHCDVCGAFLPG